VLGHDFAHRFVALKYGHDTDIRFWGMGTLILLVTAWLFGNAFAQPSRNIVEQQDNDRPDTKGLEMVAGPLFSIVFTFVFLAMIPLGGIFAELGAIGFTMNLLAAVYGLMPIDTMDGKAIWEWNRPVFLVLFIPMLLFYFIVYVFV
jgi:hypothetical protein